jgi:hypothetical protein
MNPAVLTRLDQLELEWQQRLLRQPSSGKADKGGVGDPTSSPSARPEGRDQMVRQPVQW